MCEHELWPGYFIGHCFQESKICDCPIMVERVARHAVVQVQVRPMEYGSVLSVREAIQSCLTGMGAAYIGNKHPPLPIGTR